ncbi:ribonuclease H-like domain-containing protein, partial [Tanacetum coccineum]
SSSDNTKLINNLDADNPLHIQTNDNSNIALIPFKLLGTGNYRIWASAMKLALQAINKCNAIVLTWLMNYVPQDVYMGLVYSDNAPFVWKELKSTYDKVDGSVIFNLLQKINNVKQDGSCVDDYYHRLNSFWRKFDALTKLHKCVCEVKCSCAASSELVLHKQLKKLIQFLMGLNDVSAIGCAFPTRDSSLPEVNDAYTIVFREESQRGFLRFCILSHLPLAFKISIPPTARLKSMPPLLLLNLLTIT